ncbi:MAG TPA: aldo/keto reductase [Candidatus Paceibacterota bacterium]
MSQAYQRLGPTQLQANLQVWQYTGHMDDMNLASSATLSNGVKIPLLGLGMWKMTQGDETVNAVTWALEAGYRHIDTAKYYANEASVGRAVRESGVARDKVFVTTKLWPSDFSNPRRGFEESLKKLGLEYIDLYLIHWPEPGISKNVWQSLEKIYDEGLAKAIGVSNYDRDDIESVLSYANVAPMVNQVEFNPASHSLPLLEYCDSKGIVTEAYSPLGRGNLISNRVVEDVARKYEKSPSQVLIRWALQHGTVVIPKSSNKERIQQNAEVFDFDISDQDMQALNALDA